MESHWRSPMNFYVAANDDPRLHTVSMDHDLASEGIRTWITGSEMQALLTHLQHLDVIWTDSKKSTPFKPWVRRDDGHDTFAITVITSKGTTRAGIRVARMCDELLKLDAVMPTLRLRWQFQTLRWDDGCVIPGYDNSARPPESR